MIVAQTLLLLSFRQEEHYCDDDGLFCKEDDETCTEYFDALNLNHLVSVGLF